jgi:hypothetical protein
MTDEQHEKRTDELRAQIDGLEVREEALSAP